MTKTPKLIANNGPFAIYRAGHIIIIERDGELFCNLRKADRGFADPIGYVAAIIAAEEEAAVEAAELAAARRERAGEYLAERADRKIASPGFDF